MAGQGCFLMRGMAKHARHYLRNEHTKKTRGSTFCPLEEEQYCMLFLDVHFLEKKISAPNYSNSDSKATTTSFATEFNLSSTFSHYTLLSLLSFIFVIASIRKFGYFLLRQNIKEIPQIFSSILQHSPLQHYLILVFLHRGTLLCSHDQSQGK